MALTSAANLVMIDLLACVQDSFNWCMLHHISCLFNVIRMKIGSLDELGEDERFGGDRALLIKMIVLVCYIFFQIFSYSMLGTELTDASSSIAEAVYKSRWYDRPVTEQRLLLLIMLRSQRGAYLTASDFFVVDRASFAMVNELNRNCYPKHLPKLKFSIISGY
ncbi:uncharacterized protein LOC128745441 [Sabethes cyaneus]|uniref:uncharacterized protein LOC128745441 n=1 Tax=Sabethes cyaneus TaxID=53552 RepID=UPI00237E33FF|nr:uncharacterized protein LOC128745441 [Sabethes cyaneus]